MSDFINPLIDPTSELADVLDAILRDLAQVVRYEHVRILLLPSVLDVHHARREEDDVMLITVRDLGTLGALLAPVDPIPLDRYPLNRLLMRMQKPIVIADTHYSDLWVKGRPNDGVRGWIGAPLVVKGESIGVLTLHSSAPHIYTERDGIVVFAFASQAAEAIDKVRLLDQAQSRLHAMMALYDASLDVIGQTQDPERLLQTLMRRAVELLRAEAGAIYLIDPDRVTLRVAITHGFVEEYRGFTLAVGEGLGGRVFETGEPIVVDDYRRWPGRSEQYRNETRFSAIIGVPLRWRRDVLGVLEIMADARSRTFTSQDRWLAELFANQVAIAMSNARLVEQSRRRLAELAALRNVSLQMTSSLDLEQVLDAICANVLSLTTAEDTHIYLYDAETDTFTNAVALWRSGEHKPAVMQPRRGGLTDRVRRGGEAIVIDDAPAHELYSSPEAQAWGIKSIAGFPLKRAGRALGVFTVAYVVPHHFGEDELRMLNLLADQAAIAIDNALAYRQLQSMLAERERTQQALIRSESLAAVGQLVAGVAHELNNPLASVSSLIQSALETLDVRVQAGADSTLPAAIEPLGVEETIELADDLTFSLKELRRAGDIVNSLLDLSRQSQSYTEEVDLSVVCQDALRILHNKLKLLPLEIVEQYADDLPRVHGNFANLGQVALNIIENAAEALGRQPGRIVVTTGSDAPRAEVWFAVADTGPGIPSDVMPNIFHPFFTTKRPGVGTGLGLYISYEIVKKHGGEIRVSTSAAGTEFRVVLPQRAPNVA